MKKRDFIQAACIEFMPVLGWDISKTLGYAEKLWQRLDAKGYGEPRQNGPHEITKAYDKLPPVTKTAFDLFWLAFDLKKGKDEAAGVWLQMGEQSKADYDKIISAARHAAAERKTLPEGQVPIMAQGWLSKRRWLDKQATPVDQAQKQQREQQQALQKINQDLAHAKRMAEQSGDPYWQAEAQTLTDQLRQTRATHDKQPQN